MKSNLTFLLALLISCIMATSLKGESPFVFWVNDEIQPGETVQVIGTGFEGLKSIQVAEYVNSTLKTKWHKVQPIQPSDSALKFILPSSLAGKMYEYKIETSKGDVRGVLNRPQLWWSMGDQGERASLGGELYLYGKNIPADEHGNWAVILSGPDKRRVIMRGDRYHGKTHIPRDLKPGKYHISFENNYDGKVDVDCSIVLAESVDKTSIGLNVKSFGAVGDAIHDDTEAFELALKKCEDAKGGEIHISRGRYKITRTLYVPQNTIIKGESRDSASLFWPDEVNPKEPWIMVKDHVTIEDVSLYCGNCLKFISAGHDETAGGFVTLRGVRIRASIFNGHPTIDEQAQRLAHLKKYGYLYGAWLVELAGEGNSVTDCDLFGPGGCVALHRCRYTRVAGNRFGMGRIGGTVVRGAVGLDLSNNTYYGCDMSTSCGAGGLGYGNLKNLYLAHNTFSRIPGWNREAVTSDAPAGFYLGKIVSAEGDSIKIGQPITRNVKELPGAALFVIGGTGKGQWREVLSGESDQVKIDRPLDIPPDPTSVITIIPQISRWLVVGNTFSEVGAAVQLFGSSVDCIISNNQSSRSEGYSGYSLAYADGLQPSWYVQWLDNSIDDGGYYQGKLSQPAFAESRFKFSTMVSTTAYDNLVLSLGVIAKRNLLKGSAYMTVTADLSGSSKVSAGIQQVVIEKNQIRNSSVGIEVTSAPQGVLLRKNKMENVDLPYRIQSQNVYLEK